ncbi:MAG: putative zinc-binding protein [bacterium]|nr:putative zinc-binding protein [bacterium]
MFSKIKVIPCSGMGKVYGLLARESALRVTQNLRPQECETMCLAYLVTGDQEAREKIEGKNCITLDGCPAMCAAKNVEMAGGIVVDKMKMIDIMKEYKGAKPGTATELTEEGWQIVDEIAERIAAKVKKLAKEEE